MRAGSAPGASRADGPQVGAQFFCCGHGHGVVSFAIGLRVVALAAPGRLRRVRADVCLAMSPIICGSDVGVIVVIPGISGEDFADRANGRC